MKTKNLTSPNLPAIDGAELLRLGRTGVIREAENLRREVSKALAALNSAAIVALALSIAPGESAAVAVTTLKSKVSGLLGLLSASSDGLQAAQRAEQHRLAGVVAAAAHRSLEVAGTLSGIESRIRHGESGDKGKRDRLRAAGLSGAELDHAAAPFDPSDLQAERTALLVEQTALETFLRTRDPADLPPGFANDLNGAA